MQYCINEHNCGSMNIDTSNSHYYYYPSKENSKNHVEKI